MILGELILEFAWVLFIVYFVAMVTMGPLSGLVGDSSSEIVASVLTASRLLGFSLGSFTLSS